MEPSIWWLALDRVVRDLVNQTHLDPTIYQRSVTQAFGSSPLGEILPRKKSLLWPLMLSLLNRYILKGRNFCESIVLHSNEATKMRVLKGFGIKEPPVPVFESL